MKVTCGSFVIDNENRILLCRTTGTASDWTIPKGLLENDELPHMAAKRELLEETGIDIIKHPHTMTELGLYPYTHRNKILAGFLFQLEGTIKQKLFCKSTFMDLRTGRRLPEVDLYAWVPMIYTMSYMKTEQVKLLKQHMNKGE